MSQSLGLLSCSFNFISFDPFKACEQKYPITEYQPVYFVAESFKDAKNKVKEYAATLKRPFKLRYDAHTQSVTVLDSVPKLASFANAIKSELDNLCQAVENI